MEGQICAGLVSFLKEGLKAKASTNSNKKRPTADVSPEDKGKLDKNRSPQQPLIVIQPQQLSATPFYALLRPL